MPDVLKAREGDVVELTEDLPKYGFQRGQRAIVIEAFDEPSEAYDLEVIDGEGNTLDLAYSVRPHQIVNISREAFEQGWAFFSQGKKLEAGRAFRKAIDMKPNYTDVLNHAIIRSYGEAGDL